MNKEKKRVINGADIAVLVLDRKVEGVEPIKVWDSKVDGDEVGQTFTLVGWGEYGVVGESTDNLKYGKLHRGSNVVTSTENNFITYKFDEGD